MWQIVQHGPLEQENKLIAVGYWVLILCEENNYFINLKHSLEKNGFKVLNAHSLVKAYECLQSNRVDFILCKDQIGDLTANAILVDLKKRNFLTGIPFCVIYSQSVSKEELLLSLDLGVDHFFFEPMDDHALKLSLDDLQRKKSQLSLFDSVDFKTFISCSKRPICLVKNSEIIFKNDSFNELFGAKEKSTSFLDLFDLSGDSQRLSDFEKFEFGMKPSLKLKNVNSALNQVFDLILFNGKYMDPKTFIVELYPKETQKEVDSGIANEYYLSSRELQVAELSKSGMTIKTIASQLELSPRTIERHRSNIMLKTNSSNMVEALGKLTYHVNRALLKT